MESKHEVPGPQASARFTEEGTRFNRTLFAALDALEEHGISYALIGGVAASGLGRPRSTHDIDIFVRPEDAEATLDALSRNGFDTEKTDVKWLFKGWRDNHMVDIIFKSSGDIYFDEEMSRHAKLVTFHGRQIRTVSPEDLIIIKCAIHNEAGPHHWHDALSILSQATVDWDYLLKRSRKAPRRLLALLIYAQSNDILIPSPIIADLFQIIFGDPRMYPHTAQSQLGQQVQMPMAAAPAQAAAATVAATSTPPQAVAAAPLAVKPDAQFGAVEHPPKKEPDMYVSGRIKDALAKDERTAASDIRIYVSKHHVVAQGESSTEYQRTAIEDVIREHAPNYQIDNQIRVPEMTGPVGVEEVT